MVDPSVVHEQQALPSKLLVVAPAVELAPAFPASMVALHLMSAYPMASKSTMVALEVFSETAAPLPSKS